jgi:hypothetical protein
MLVFMMFLISVFPFVLLSSFNEIVQLRVTQGNTTPPAPDQQPARSCRRVRNLAAPTPACGFTNFIFAGFVSNACRLHACKTACMYSLNASSTTMNKTTRLEIENAPSAAAATLPAGIATIRVKHADLCILSLAYLIKWARRSLS